MSVNYEKLVNDYMWANGELSSVARGKRFLDWVLLKLFNRTETELDNNDIEDGVLFTDGANDYGIDCAFVDGDVLYILQGKFRNTHNYSNVYHYINQIKDFFDLADARNVRTKLVDVFDKIYDEDIHEIKVYYVTGNYIQNEAIEHEYKEKCAEIEDKYSKKFSKNFTFNIIGYEDFHSVHTGILFELPTQAKIAKHRLLLENYFENRDSITVVAEVSLKYIAQMVSKHKDYIFSSNIRNFKGMNKINKGIQESYQKNPKDFWYYNNGITIVCNDYTLNTQTGVVDITAPQIVNGCQTSNIIYKCWKESNETERNNNQGTILVKIIKDKNKNKRNNITKYTNSQTAVSGKDFFALDGFHKELKERFEEAGYFYETQSNSAKVNTRKFFGCEKYAHMFDAKFTKNNVLMAKEITQTYIATILKMPAKAKNIGEFMPGCPRYEMAYNDKTPYDIRFYLFPYGVWYYLKNVYELPASRLLDKDKWTASLLFTSYIFFKIISKLYCDNTENYQSEEFINVCEEKITDVGEFEKLTQITYNVLRDFYKDSTIKDIIGDNLPKFLKNTIESNQRVKEILDDQIAENIDGVI